jgi:hypothetical protein
MLHAFQIQNTKHETVQAANVTENTGFSKINKKPAGKSHPAGIKKIISGLFFYQYF